MPTIPPQGTGGNVGEVPAGLEFVQEAIGSGLTMTLDDPIDMLAVAGVRIRIIYEATMPVDWRLVLNGINSTNYTDNGVVIEAGVVTGSTSLDFATGILVAPIEILSTGSDNALDIVMTTNPAFGFNFLNLTVQSTGGQAGAYFGGGEVTVAFPTLTTILLDPIGNPTAVNTASAIQVWKINK